MAGLNASCYSAAVLFLLPGGPASAIIAMFRTSSIKKHLKWLLISLLVWAGSVALIYLIRVNYTKKKYWELVKGFSASM